MNGLATTRLPPAGHGRPDRFSSGCGMSSGGRGNMAGGSGDFVPQWSPGLQAAVPADDAIRARDAAARADALHQRGDFRSALPLYAEAVRLQPGVPQYHFGLAAAALRCDRRELVEPHLLAT